MLLEAWSPWAVLLTPNSQVSPTVSGQKKNPETSVWFPRAGLSPGVILPPVDV